MAASTLAIVVAAAACGGQAATPSADLTATAGPLGLADDQAPPVAGDVSDTVLDQIVEASRGHQEFATVIDAGQIGATVGIP